MGSVGMSEAIWHRYGNRLTMIHAAAARILAITDKALDQRSAAFLAFPGGRSPVSILEQLAATKPDWRCATVIPTDDRLVLPTDSLSNYGMIAGHLQGTGTRVVPLVGRNIDDGRAAGLGASARLLNLRWPLDLAWLGVGVDGHTASIFPGPDMAAALDSASSRLAIGVTPDPLPAEAPVGRVTLTAAALSSARHVMMAFSGIDKRTVVEEAIRLGANGVSPIAQVLARIDVPVEIHWSPV